MRVDRERNTRVDEAILHAVRHFGPKTHVDLVATLVRSGVSESTAEGEHDVKRALQRLRYRGVLVPTDAGWDI